MDFKRYFYLIMLILFGSFLVFQEESYSDEFKNYKESDGSIILSSDSCDKLLLQIKDLNLWRNKLGEITSKDIPKCTCESENNCQLNISSFLPFPVKNSMFKKPDYYGPNCWNTTLLANNILSFQRFSTPSEISFWVNSSFCRELNSKEKLEPGDVITIRSLNSSDSIEEVHGFTYINSDISFSKNGPATLSPVMIHGTDEIFNFYQVNSLECRRIEKKDGNKCGTFGNAYRCESFAQHQLNHLEPIDSEYVEIKKSLDANEKEVSNLTMYFRQNQINQNDLNNTLIKLNNNLQFIESRIFQKIHQGFRDIDEEEYWKLLLERSKSTLLQISFF